jgi:VWFA-related protein
MFKSSTTLVEVDAIVLDTQGHFVPGLTAEDVTLLEDGKRQQIQQFYMVTHDLSSNSGSAARQAQTTEETTGRARRVFVMLFDEEHLANESLMRVKKGAEDFIRDQFGPGDVGGVFVNGAMYKGRLTDDKIELVSGVRSAKPAFDNRQALLAGFRDFPRIPSEVDAVRIADGAQELADAIGTEDCTDDPFLCLDKGGLNQVESLVQQKARLYIGQARVMTAQTLQNLQYVINNLSRVPGRKTVVFLSEGFLVEESRAALQTLAAQAARGGTVIYSVDGRGNINSMSVNPDVIRTSQDRSTAFDTGEDGPNILTSVTGGLRLRGIDDISRVFGLITNDTSTYYVIGYAPENAALDGKFRKIEVKTTTKGLQIRARQGYMATPLPPQLSLRTGAGGF